jgi:hypothetical protein
LALALSGAAVAQPAAAPTLPIKDRLSGHFDHPNAPEAFRPLTGAGYPRIAADDGEPRGVRQDRARRPASSRRAIYRRESSRPGSHKGYGPAKPMIPSV